MITEVGTCSEDVLVDDKYLESEWPKGKYQGPSVENKGFGVVTKYGIN